jgi:hypothetical protein
VIRFSFNIKIINIFFFSDASIVASLGQAGIAIVRSCDSQRTTTGGLKNIY